VIQLKIRHPVYWALSVKRTFPVQNSFALKNF